MVRHPNIEELDLAGRRCPVKAKGAQRVLDAGAARLLPRLLKGRTRDPVFVTRRRSGPGKVVGPRDCPDTGLARLSYGQARALLDEHTAVRGPGSEWDLHEGRHSGLTHLGEAGASLEVAAQKNGERPPLLQAVPGGHRRAHQPARPR